MKGRLTKKEKAIVIADIINVYNQAIAKKRLAKSSHNNDYFSKDDHELIFTIEQALRNCSKETRLIIKNDFIYKQPEVCVTDCSFFYNFFDDFNAVFHFSFALFDCGVVILNGLNFILKLLNI